MNGVNDINDTTVTVSPVYIYIYPCTYVYIYIYKILYLYIASNEKAMSATDCPHSDVHASNKNGKYKKLLKTH